MTRRILLWAPVVAYMAFIFFVSALPQAPLPSNVSDKTAHLVGYSLLGFLAVRAMHGGLPARVTVNGALMAMIITVGYAAFDEYHQSFVPGRNAEVLDVAADAAGGAAALVVCWAWGILLLRADE